MSGEVVRLETGYAGEEKDYSFLHQVSNNKARIVWLMNRYWYDQLPKLARKAGLNISAVEIKRTLLAVYTNSDRPFNLATASLDELIEISRNNHRLLGQPQMLVSCVRYYQNNLKGKRTRDPL